MRDRDRGLGLAALAPEHGAARRALVEEKVVKRGFGVYLGELELRDGPLRMLALRRFLALVAEGEIFA